MDFGDGLGREKLKMMRGRQSHLRHCTMNQSSAEFKAKFKAKGGGNCSVFIQYRRPRNQP